MQKKLVFLLLVGLSLSACGPRSTQATPSPTETPLPTLTATVTSTPTPDFSIIGLPSEPSSAIALDFVNQMCQAQWFTESGDLPCPGNESSTGTGFVGDQLCEDQQSTEAGDLSCLGNVAQTNTGFVAKLGGELQDLPGNMKLLLTFPPKAGDQTILSKYPPFTVMKGDRFRTVLACRAHTFCDVEFILYAFDDQGQTRLMHWRYIFADPPMVVDYSLDNIGGKTVQFGLAVQAKGNQADANAVWIAPHVYRPSD